MTGKGLEFGGSLIRTEATGYGTVYMLQNMLEHIKDTVEGKQVVISGSGNVATFAAEKINQLGGKVLTLSDEHCREEYISQIITVIATTPELH